MKHWVAVTGIGGICSAGMNAGEIWDSVSRGEVRSSSIDTEIHFDVSKFERALTRRNYGLINTAFGVMVHSRELAEMIDVRANRRDRHQSFAEIAAIEAVESSGVAGAGYPDRRIGTFLGTGAGGLWESHMAEVKLAEDKPLDLYCNLRQLPNIVAGHIAKRFGFKGPVKMHCTACAAGAHAIEHGMDAILLGKIDAALVGGTEAAITPFGIASFVAQGVIANSMLPNQAGRQGFEMGEGSAMFVLENYEQAVERGATIHAILIGAGSSCDGNPDTSITEPDPVGGQNAAVASMEQAGISAADVDFVSGHATATKVGDAGEIQGIKGWAGDVAPNIAFAAHKGLFGHLLGAAGPIELLVLIEMMKRGVIVPTPGLTSENLDEACRGVDHVVGSLREQVIRIALSNSFGFGGANASLVVRRSS